MSPILDTALEALALAEARARLIRLTSRITAFFWLPVLSVSVVQHWTRSRERHGLYVAILAGIVLLGAVTWVPSRRHAVTQALAFLAVVAGLITTAVMLNGPAPGAVAASCVAVAWATLFFGDRGLRAGVAVLAVGIVLAAWHFVGGAAVTPDLSPPDAEFWLRGGVLLLGSCTIIGLIVRAAVGAYERTLESERAAQAAAAREETARLVAEAEADVLQRRHLVGALASGLAHDLNNVIQVTGANAEMLRESALSADDQDSVSQILTAAERARRMVRDLLALGRPALKEAKGRGFDGADAVRRLELMLRSAMTRPVHAEFDAGPQCALAGEALHFEQVLINLVLNARDAMPAGGTVSVALREENELECRLEVRDTGTGIPSELHERVFAPFYTTKGAEEGSGLGLSAVARAVRDVGGRIVLESSPGAGTTFFIFWPRLPRDRTAAP